MRIPARITAGDTVTWSEFALQSAFGAPINSGAYVLSFSFRGPVQASGFDITGTANGGGWDMSISAGESGGMNAGTDVARWFWQAYATASSQRQTVGKGVLLVEPNLMGLTGAAFDGRSKAEQILTQIDNTILARTTGGAVQEYTIGTRSLKYMPMADLLALKSRYQTIVARERKAQRLKNGLGSPDRIGVRFRNG